VIGVGDRVAVAVGLLPEPRVDKRAYALRWSGPHRIQEKNAGRTWMAKRRDGLSGGAVFAWKRLPFVSINLAHLGTQAR
jgi:hypothetical protein